MKNLSLVEFSIKHPAIIFAISAIITIIFLTQFPKVTTDTNPKNMLPPDSGVRVLNDKVEKLFGLYEDTIVVGIVNEKGVLNADTLGKIRRITDAILYLDGVASRDVVSFSTIDDLTAEGDVLRVGPLMESPPSTEEELKDFKERLFSNPMFLDRVISGDATTTAIYVPLEKGANGKAVADRIREITAKEKGIETYHIAGDPVARDTFGSEMFKLMGVFSPIAGMIMFAAAYFMFRSFFLSVSIMIPALMIIIWSMGLLIGLGFPVHIMSSMAPVFLMAIATDSIHIFNEFSFRYREKNDKKAAIMATMESVGVPLIYSDITTAVGFASLLLANIIPVKVFGFGVAFGTMILLLSSFTLIPALLTLINVEKLKRASPGKNSEVNGSSRRMRALGSIGANSPKATVAVGLVFFIAAVIGITRINVNNNMVSWFKKGSDMRIADTAMNESLGGTSLAYVVVGGKEDDYMKTPEAMLYVEGLQRHIETLPFVGKTHSVADYVKRINRTLHSDSPQFDRIPDTKEIIGQYLFLFSMSAKPSDLDNVIDYSFKNSNVWVQMKTWDAGAMRELEKSVKEYAASHPSPLSITPAGPAYFNLVWNNEVLYDMLKGFIVALVVVFAILALNFKSVTWAIVGYIPLLFTILLIYGAVGFLGKDFDMPIAVLSCLSLGMAVDFSIHFIGRLRQKLAEEQGLASTKEGLVAALTWTAERPGKGIFRNAVLFASAFSVMLFAPLTPYVTVGAFIASMMFLSAIITMIYLPALIILFRKQLLKQKEA